MPGMNKRHRRRRKKGSGVQMSGEGVSVRTLVRHHNAANKAAEVAGLKLQSAHEYIKFAARELNDLREALNEEGGEVDSADIVDVIDRVLDPLDFTEKEGE